VSWFGDMRRAIRVSDEHGHGIALGLVHGFGDVSCVFAVHLKRKRVVAADDDAIEITCGKCLPLLET
jgi:hypothetical protein